MKCGHCGKSLFPGAKICPNCYHQVSSGYHGVPNPNHARDVIGSSSGSYRYKPDKGSATHTFKRDTPKPDTSYSYRPDKASATYTFRRDTPKPDTSYSYRPDKASATHSVRRDPPKPDTSSTYRPDRTTTSYTVRDAAKKAARSTYTPPPKANPATQATPPRQTPPPRQSAPVSHSSGSKQDNSWILGILLLAAAIFFVVNLMGGKADRRREDASLRATQSTRATFTTEYREVQDPFVSADIPETIYVAETFYIPETTVPPTTVPPTTEAIRHLDDIFVENRGVGHCHRMVGDIGLLFIFLDDAESSWNQQDIDNFLYKAQQQTRRLEEDARSRGVSLRFLQYSERASVSANIHLDTMSSNCRQVIAATGRDAATANQVIADQLGLDQAVPLFIVNKNGRSAAFQSWDCEMAFILQGTASLAHEICHVFGAADYYYPDEADEYASIYLPGSIMSDAEDGHVDDLTAYLIGWTDTLSYNAQSFLDSLSWMTQEDLDAAYEEHTFTGYGTIQYDHCYYEGNIVEGFPHGFGSIYWENGDVFQGEHNNGYQIGNGTYRWASGTHYEGQMEDYHPHGYGTMTWPSGQVRTGNWNMGQFVG